MLSTDSSFASSGPCGHADALRDYAFDELAGDARQAIEQHIATCRDCALELDQLQLTTAALRTLPDREIPQRIAFVSDGVFEPSGFRRFWKSGAGFFQNMAGFASACVLAVAMVISAWHLSSVNQPTEVRTVVQTVSASPDQINAAVEKAVAQVRAEDAKMIQAAIQTSERQQDAEYRSQIVAMQENFDRLRRKFNLNYASLASNDLTGAGAGQ